MTKTPKFFVLLLAILLGFASLQLLKLIEPTDAPTNKTQILSGSLTDTP